MAAFKVEVNITNKKELTIYARDEDEAQTKAEELVSGWNNVIEVEVVSVERQ